MERGEQARPPTEDMALLGHQHTERSLTSDEDELAYPYEEPQIHEHPAGEQLWTKFEVHRRSAEDYLRLFRKCMDRINASIPEDDNGLPDYSDMEPPHQVAQQDTGNNTDIIRLKIYTDTLLRDLIVLEDIAIQTQQTYESTEPPLIKPAPAFL